MNESTSNPQSQSSVTRKILYPIIAIIGPAAVMAAGIMGAGSTVSTLAAGCWFGYALLWAVFFSLPAIVVCQDTASRIGAVSGQKGMMRLIADNRERSSLWLSCSRVHIMTPAPRCIARRVFRSMVGIPL